MKKLLLLGIFIASQVFAADKTIIAETITAVTKSRIARLGIIPEREEEGTLSAPIIIGSQTDRLILNWQNEEFELIEGQRIMVKDLNSICIWVTTINKDLIGTISNAELYYGLPIPDYKIIVPQTSTALKTTLKIDDKLIISLSAIKVKKEISFTISSTTTSLIITSTDIKQGSLTLISDNINTWMATATDNGSFTISNSNLYSGPLVLNYTNLSGLIVKNVIIGTGGYAAADLGVIAQGIQLFDNGMPSFDDKIAGDGVYSGFYKIKEKDNGIDVPIFGHFIYNNCNALNDPYTNERMKVDIDGTRPLITNQNIEPNPFNPYIKNLSIKYYLSEDARVRINILNATGTVYTIVSPDPKFGENISDFWDGRDKNASIVPDGIYYYTIDAKDSAGNEANTVTGEIKVTSVEIKIENLTFSPNPFYSDNIPESSDVLIKFRAVLKSSAGGTVTNTQLNNLGFDFVQGSYSLNIPYALLNFETYDEQGKKILYAGYPDMSKEDDLDPWLWGLPNYNLSSYTLSLGNPLKPDEGDGDKENDQGTLVPFYRDAQGNYYQDYEYGELDWKNPPGNYTVRVWAELVSIAWDLTSEPTEGTETWHAKPRYHGHYKLRSDVLDGIMRCVENPEIIEGDKSPPIISECSPFSNECKNPGEVSSVWTKLYDSGVGVHPINSSIYLEDALGQKIPGVLTNNGKDTIYWNLTKPLMTPGTYVVKISAVDFKGNSATYSFTFSVTDSMPPIISSPFPAHQSTITASFNGPITVNISEIKTGQSGIDWNKTTISLKKDGLDISLTKDYTETGSNIGQLKGILTFSLNKSGTYTIYVTAYDKSNNGTQGVFYFTIPSGILGDDEPPTIIHTPSSVAFVNEPMNITATIIDTGVGIASITLSYQPVGSQTIERVSISPTSPNTFTFTHKIVQTNTGSLYYWIKAIDKNENVRMGTYTTEFMIRDDVNIEKSVYTSPNPAKGHTKFRVVLTDNAKVYIKVYSITGGLVWDYEGNFGSGAQFIPYNCINKDGNKLGTGLYIYKVTIEYPTKKETTIKKMVIIKQ